MSRDIKTNRVKRCCNECGEVIKRNEEYTTLEVYDSPWRESKTIYVHMDNEIRENGLSCEEALYDERWEDFRYFNFYLCNRTISRQCRSNGWHFYVRETDDGEEICLSCYEENILAHGIPWETFAQHTIAGMFFNQGELREKGWERVLREMFLNSETSVSAYCKEAIHYIDQGYKVVTDYESLGIGGGEGYVSLWIKKDEDSEHDIPLFSACQERKGGASHGRIS